MISSGNGPVEVRRFVGLLAERLAGELQALGLRLVSQARHGESRAPGSVELLLEGAAPERLAAYLGTHELLSRSPERGKRARKRWFAAVTLHPAEPEAARPLPALRAADVRFQAIRASGPGGQNVNKVASAVRAVHLPTGLAVRADEQRTQSRNKKLALERLEHRLREDSVEQLSGLRQVRWLEHHALQRGNAVLRWKLDANQTLTIF